MNHKPFIYFAPFQGITTQPFREVYAHHFQGVDKLFTPYFSNIAIGYPLPPLKMKALRNRHENGIPIIPQILSKSAGEMLSFANCCAELGFEELNWNLGCPYPQVARKLRGSGILPFPDKVDEILNELMPHIPLRLSVKCRLGYYSPDEIMELIPVFNRYPISELTIHARIGKQLYSGNTDLKSFENAQQALQLPVVYNGDIFTKEDHARLKSFLPDIDSLMIGRGILQDPFLPARIKGLPLPDDTRKALRNFLDDLYFETRRNKKDTSSALNAMKEFWTYFIHSFQYPQGVFRKLKKVKTFDEYEDGINRIFEEDTLRQFANCGANI